MGDGGLGQSDRVGEVADAGFLVVVSGHERDEPQPGGVGEGLQRGGEGPGLGGSHHLSHDRRAAGGKGVRLVEQSQRDRHRLILGDVLTSID
jgi:hypothetical protein